MDNSRFSVLSLAPIWELFSKCCFRTELRKSITPSRLGNMLTRKGIDLQYYLYSQTTSDIVTQMQNCEHCHSLEQCDCYLENEKTDSEVELPFCRNNDPIRKVKQQQESLYVKN